MTELPNGGRLEDGSAPATTAELIAHLESLGIHVPMANLVLLPDAKAHRGKLTIHLVARDAAGGYSEPVVVRMPFEVAHRDVSWALTQTVDYETEMILSGPDGEIAVGVHDDLGFTSSTVGVEIGSGDEGGR